MEKAARIFLAVFGLGFAAFALLFLISPAMLTTLADIQLPTSTAAVEVRSVYGGMFLGVGALMLFFARSASGLRPGMVVLGILSGGLVIGRTLGFLFDGAANWLIYTLYVSEIIGLVV